MPHSFIGLTLILAFVFGALGIEAHRTQLSVRETAEEDTASEEREEKALRASKASRRAARPKGIGSINSAPVFVASLNDSNRIIFSTRFYQSGPILGVHLRRSLRILQI